MDLCACVSEERTIGTLCLLIIRGKSRVKKGSKTPHIHWVVSKHTVRLDLVVTYHEVVYLDRRGRNQRTWVYVIVRSVVVVGRVLCGCLNE